MSRYHTAEENDPIISKLSIISTESSEFDVNNFSKTKRFLLTLILSFSILLLTLFVFINNGSKGSIFNNIRVPFHIKNSVEYKYDFVVKLDSYDSIDLSDYLPWEVIVEPYKQQTLTLNSITISNNNIITSDSFSEITWNINSESYSGNAISLFMTDTGVTSATVTVITTDGITYQKDFKVAVKYVRREIRTLTDEDRNKFLDALHTLYKVPTEEGMLKLGSKYKSAKAFLSRHLNGAARSDCDHWHDNAGIVNHHVALTLEVEQALQTIDPTISLPYWEYAMDEFLYDNWQDSPVFNDDWFGNNSPMTEDHSLSTGRWADVTTPWFSKETIHWDITETGSLNPFHNARGQLRSPWNNNPSSKFSRHNMTYNRATQKIPSCDSVSTCIHSTSVSTMFDCLNGLTHGAVHIMIGGLWGEGDTFTSNPKLEFLQSLERLLVFKMLWRNGFSRCPSECNLPEDAPSLSSNDDCKCYVPDEYIETYGVKNILKGTGIWGVFNQFEDMSDDQLLSALRAIEDPGIAGDMFTSGASYDPIFWPVHGLLERILSLKRIRVSQGTITNFNEEWGYSTKESHYLKGRCDWSNIEHSADLTLPTCDYSDEAYCWGHEEDDILEFGNFLNKGETYTNGELYDFIHPWNDDLPYVYDTYEFDYCTENGYTIL